MPSHICQYNLQWDSELTCGTQGSQSGELCSVDKHSNFLIADKDKNHLQVYLSRQQT